MVKTTRIEGLLEAIELATSPVEIEHVIRQARDLYEIDHVAYYWLDSFGETYGWDTFSEAWQTRYRDQKYLRVDPVVIGCYQRFNPVDWKQLDWAGKAARAYLNEAMEHGLGSQGYSVPVRGPNGQFALFTVNHRCDDELWQTFIRVHRRDFFLLAHALHAKAVEFGPVSNSRAAPSLSPREVDAITLLAVGYSRAQVADSLSISEHTLRDYIESARFKLGALNTTHAVARALSRGLIFI